MVLTTISREPQSIAKPIVRTITHHIAKSGEVVYLLHGKLHVANSFADFEVVLVQFIKEQEREARLSEYYTFPMKDPNWGTRLVIRAPLKNRDYILKHIRMLPQDEMITTMEDYLSKYDNANREE